MFAIIGPTLHHVNESLKTASPATHIVCAVIILAAVSVIVIYEVLRKKS